MRFSILGGLPASTPKWARLVCEILAAVAWWCLAALGFLFMINHAARADELILPRATLERLGYQRQEYPARRIFAASIDSPQLLSAPVPAHSLAWPVRFQDSSHNMGNTLMQFQNYGGDESYFHGGCDLRAADGADIVAPVTGHIEAGHYAYEVNDDGSLTKTMKPWPATGEALYFEVSIVTDAGFRFEFHHINRATLPSSIVSLLNHGGGQVQAGTLLGHVSHWPVSGVDGELYHHTHYNIIGPDGTHWNPEFLSTALDDREAPVIHQVFAVSASNQVTELRDNGKLASPTQEFIVATTDKQGSDVYTHTPPLVELIYDDGHSSRWDFRETLTDDRGMFPNIWSVFKDSLRTPAGQVLRTEGNYQSNFFLIRLPVPAGATGAFEIHVADSAGNLSRLRAQ